MTREGEEVAIHSLHIYRKMRSRLRSVYQYGHAVVVGYADNLIHGIDSSERIADMSYADNLGLFAEQLLVSLHIELSSVIHRYYLERNATLGGLQLPGHYVGVVLHNRHYHLIALVHKLLAERRNDKIDALRCATGEDYLLGLGSVDKLAHGFTSSLVQVGGTLRQIMHATMHIGIGVEIFIAHSIEHAQWFLCRSRIVEINERTVVDGARKYGEVGTDFIDIIHISNGRGKREKGKVKYQIA